MARVLALDLARATGWAADAKRPTVPGRPDRGVWRLPGIKPDVIGDSYAKIFTLVTAAINVHRIDVVAWEQPLPAGASNKTAPKATWLVAGLHGLAAVVECAAKLKGCETYDVHPQTARRHFTGSGRPRFPKRTVIRHCLERGWMVGDDNAADACCIWSYMKSCLEPASAAGLTPLFIDRGEAA
jgi:hypothetical protein